MPKKDIHIKIYSKEEGGYILDTEIITEDGAAAKIKHVNAKQLKDLISKLLCDNIED